MGASDFFLTQKASVSHYKPCPPGGGEGPGQGTHPTNISGCWGKHLGNDTPDSCCLSSSFCGRRAGSARPPACVFTTVTRTARTSRVEHFADVLAPKTPTKLSTDPISQMRKTETPQAQADPLASCKHQGPGID